VCAAGLSGSAADDVAKEVAIFRAHAGVPLVIATDAEERFAEASGVIRVPSAHPELAFVLSTMAGHLYGYHAARAIDAQARPLREARAAIEAAVEESPRRPAQVLARIAPALEPIAATISRCLAAGEYDGTMEASTAYRIVEALRSSTTHAHDGMGGVSAPGAIVDDLTEALTAGIDELTRPIDAIKHQAKTVTVGISRADEEVLTVPLVAQLLGLGVERTLLPYSVLKALVALDPAVEAVTGHTRYRLEGDAQGMTVAVVDQGGVAAGLPSRTERDARLRGTKRQVATEREVLASIGRSDGRPFVIVPEIEGGRTIGLTLLHVDFAESLPLRQTEHILRGYRGRLALLESLVTETESAFEVERLANFSLTSLLTDPVEELAKRWVAEEAGDGVAPGPVESLPS
jgi:glucosamine--fructose-6-phosphate aminotransferase (isomerizing)